MADKKVSIASPSTMYSSSTVHSALSERIPAVLMHRHRCLGGTKQRTRRALNRVDRQTGWIRFVGVPERGESVRMIAMGLFPRRRRPREIGDRRAMCILICKFHCGSSLAPSVEADMETS